MLGILDARIGDFPATNGHFDCASPDAQSKRYAIKSFGESNLIHCIALAHTRGFATQMSNRGNCVARRSNALRGVWSNSPPCNTDLRRALLGVPGQGLPGRGDVNVPVVRLVHRKAHFGPTWSIGPSSDKLLCRLSGPLEMLFSVTENRLDLLFTHTGSNPEEVRVCYPIRRGNEQPRQADNESQEQNSAEPDGAA
jgi:hypothetical protein